MSQDIAIIAETVTVQQKQTINGSASLSLASGAQHVVGSGASISMTSGATLAGTVTVPTGANVNLASGASMSLAAGANLVAPSAAIGAAGTASVSVATANNTTIPVAQGIVRASSTAATTSGSCTLAAGSLDGQEVTVVNEGASNIVISGNMKGSAAVTIAANNGQKMVWISADTAWFPI